MQRRKKHHHDWKYHLRNLPDIGDFPDWQGRSKFACLLIPVFSFDKSTEHIENYVARAAAWAMYTWKTNSDAKLFNIPCYFYLESTIATAAIKILKAHGVPDDNIMVADFLNTERLAKCLQPVFDKKLEEYEYIVISDVDMFVVKGEKGDNLQFFEKLMVNRPKGFISKIHHEMIPTYWMAHYDKTKWKDNGKLIEKWINSVVALSGNSEIRYNFDNEITDDRPWTGTMAISKGLFSDKKWFEKACKLLGDDEAVTYIWSKVSESNKLFNITDIGVVLFRDLMEYVGKCYEYCMETHDINEIVFENIYFNEPCLLHHYASLDYKFYKTIGVV